MTRIRIRHLDVARFRGISSQRTLPFEGKSVLLFGENGTGKSSFVDAIERLFSGRVSTLDGRGQGISSEECGPHIRWRHVGPSISVTFGDNQVVDLDTRVPELAQSLQEYVRAAEQPVYILRRGQVLEFIESKPRERYGMLRPYLPLTDVERIEAVLKDAQGDADRDASVAKRAALQRSRELRAVLGLEANTEDLSEGAVIDALNARIAQTATSPLLGLSAIPEIVGTIDEELSGFGDISKPTALNAAITALDELNEALGSLDLEPALRSLLALRKRETEETKIIYERVLEEGAEWIEKEKRTECPLCEQEMLRFSPEEVARRARSRVEERRGLLNLRRAAESEAESLSAALASHARTARRASALVEKAPEEARAKARPLSEAAAALLDKMAAEVRKPTPHVDSASLEALAAQLGSRGLIAQGIRDSIALLRAEMASLPSTALAQRLLQHRQLLTRAGTAWDEIARSRSLASRTEETERVARTVLETFQQARKEIVAELFDEISEDVDRIYHEMHSHHDPQGRPHADHRNLRLEVREAVQKSVNLRGDFHEVADVDPRTYYSDAHLDTLGISVFLALRLWYRRQHPAFDLMVLDDVISSVDSGHAVRLAEILLREFDDYQILLTTHDRIWFEHLRDIQARCGVAQNFVNKTIYKWTIDDGPDLREPVDELPRLKDLLSSGQPNEVAAQAGRLLEHILQEMRYNLKLSVPAKPGEIYEIGDLWPAFYKEVKRNFPGLYSEGEATLDALDVSWPLRNWVGAHFNGWARNVSADGARGLAEAVVALSELLLCPVCRRFVAPSSTPLGQIACRCGNKIYPAGGREAVLPETRSGLVARLAGTLKDAALSTDLHLEWKRAEKDREL